MLVNISAVFCQWNLQANYTSSRLESVFFPDSNTGYIVGTGGTIMKTTNGGSSWTFPSGITYPDMYFYSVYFSDANTGYIVGIPGISNTCKILKTINGGIDWYSLSYGTAHQLKIFFTDANTGYAAGDRLPGLSGIIFKTSDSGNTWYGQSVGSGESSLYAVFFPNPDTGIAVGYHGIIKKTTNAGLSWDDQVSGTTNNLLSVYFNDANNGYAVGSQGTILKTTNGGTTWININPPQSFLDEFNAVYFTDTNTGYVVGRKMPGLYGVILKTTDGGENWLNQYIGPEVLNSVYFTNPDTGYAVGVNGTILKTTNGGGTVGIYEKQQKNKITIFPNPSKELLTLELLEPAKIINSISICDITGYQHIQQQIQNSEFKMIVNVSSLSKGIYFVKLVTQETSYIGKFLKD